MGLLSGIVKYNIFRRVLNAVLNRGRSTARYSRYSRH